MARIFGSRVIWNQVFPAREEQLTLVRRAVSKATADRPECNVVILLANELAANAIKHSGSELFGLIVTRTTTGLRIAVVDEGRTGFPHLREKITEAEHGRGLQLIDDLAQRWGIVRQPGIGVAVWFDIP
jgi:anti-sigma regulatory factor (Ser/Thr protein kinase)